MSRRDHVPEDVRIGDGASSAPSPGWRAAVRSLAGRARGLRPATQAFMVFACFLALAWLWYGLPVAGRFSHAFIGSGHSDPKLFAWSLVWWPHALAEGQNPLYTHSIWGPGGTSLAYVTTIPAPSVLLWPVTATWGPVASLNLLTLLAPPLAGWAAFLVCREVTGTFWPSVAGGYFFGFSTYLLNHLPVHPNLILVFPVPLAVYLVVRRMKGNLGPAPFVVGLTLAMAVLFWTMPELFATLTVFGGLALVGALVLGPPELRRPLVRTGLLIGVAYLLTAAIALPYLLEAFRNPPSSPLANLAVHAADLLEFVIPPETTLIGGATFVDLTERFPTNQPTGISAYLGIPLVLIVGKFVVDQRRRRTTWLLVAFLVVIVVASLGPELHLAGQEVFPLPWTLVERVPLIQNAIPNRFTVYLWLVCGLIVALWLAARPESWGRWALVALAAVSIVPNLSATPYANDTSPPYARAAWVPAFFSEGDYRRYVKPNEIVLIIPYSKGVGRAADMLWQAESEMYFRLAGGHTGFIPDGHRRSTVRWLRTNQPDRLQPKAFLQYIRIHRVTAVLVADSYIERWEALLSLLEVSPEHAGGMTVYRLPSPRTVPEATE